MSEIDPERPASGTMQRLTERPPSSDRYRDDGEFARGGMGSIRRVWDSDLRRTLAMKVLLEGAKDSGGSESGSGAEAERRLTRFLEEAQVTAQLEHPGIIPVHELGLNEDGQLFFTMPLVDGDDLAEILRKVRDAEGNWTLTRAVGVLLKVCEAMGFAHSRNVVHRDLKPANIMVGAFGEVYVMDWGLARVLDEQQGRAQLKPQRAWRRSKKIRTERGDASDSDHVSPLRTLDGEVVGTPAYMAPEQARGELASVGPASDVYSIGSILYHLISGAMPFSGTSKRLGALEVWNRVKDGAPDPLGQVAPDAPEELVAICQRAMARDPLARYPDTTDMGEDLRAYLEGRVVRAHASGAWAEFRKWVGRNRSLAITALVGLVVSFGALGFAGWSQRRANQTLAGINDKLGESNQELTTVNQTLENTNKALDESRQATEAKRQEADEASAQAQLSRGEAQRQAYAAQLGAAALHLTQENPTELRRSLEQAPAHLRGWEWRFLALNQERSLLDIELFGGGARRAAWWGADRGIVAVGAGGAMGLFDLASGELQLGEQSGRFTISALGVAPHAGLFATGSRSGQLSLWDPARSRQPLRTRLWEREIAALAWSPDGQLLAAAEGDGYELLLGLESLQDARPGRIAILNPAGKLLRLLEGHPAQVSDLVFMADGKRLVSVGQGGRAYIWDVESGERLEALPNHGAPILSVDVASDGRIVISTAENSAYLWSDVRGSAPRRLEGHSEQVHDVVFSPDGKTIASASADGTLRLWDSSTLATLAVISGHQGPVVSVRFDPSGEHLLSAGWEDGMRVWEAQTGGPVAAVGPTDQQLTPLDLSNSAVGSWKPAPLSWLSLPGAGGEERYLLGEYAKASTDGARILHLGSARRLRKVFAADLWNGSTGEHQAQLTGHSDRITALALSADGTLAATGSEDLTVRIWDARDGTLIRPLGNLRATVGALAFDATGEHLAIGTADGRTLIHDLDAGLSVECAGRHQGGVTSLAWSPDASQLASGGRDKRVRLWHGRSGRELAQLFGHSGAVTSLVFHPGGKRLVSGGRDRRVHIWDPITGDSLLTLTDFDEVIQGVAFGQYGRRLIVSMGTGAPEARVFDSSILDARELWRAPAASRK
ncbi:MAG: WD40 repeat protein [Planctomycetota bacterium]